jgi:hypothetical protein
MRVLFGILAILASLAACSESRTPANPNPCEQGRYRLHGSATADYLEFIQLHGVMYVEPSYFGMRRGRVAAQDLGRRIAQVKCRLDTANIPAIAPRRDGDAAFIDPEASIYSVKGYAAACRVAARQLGKLTVFFAATRDGTHVAAGCPRS